LTKTGNNPSLTEKEGRALVDMILIGCTKVLCNAINHDPKSQARSLISKQRKSLSYTSSLNNVENIVKEKGIFRPSDIRKKLPTELQNIRGADLTYITKSLVRINVLTDAERKTKKRGKPPVEDSSSTTSDPGPKSLKEAASYYDNLMKILSEPDKVELIHRLLFYSGMLYKYMKHMQWILFHIIMMNDDKEKALNISKSVFTTAVTTSSFNDLYHKVRSTKDDTKQLEVLADRRARQYVENRRPGDYVKLFEFGGLNYQS
jgi:hypothetical protein